MGASATEDSIVAVASFFLTRGDCDLFCIKLNVVVATVDKSVCRERYNNLVFSYVN